MDEAARSEEAELLRLWCAAAMLLGQPGQDQPEQWLSPFPACAAATCRRCASEMVAARGVTSVRRKGDRKVGGPIWPSIWPWSTTRLRPRDCSESELASEECPTIRRTEPVCSFALYSAERFEQALHLWGRLS